MPKLNETSSGSPPSETDRNVLRLIFGEKTCLSSPLGQLGWYLSLVIVSTLLFAILSYPGFNLGLGSSSESTWAFKIALFFIVILVFDLAFINWRSQHPPCQEGFDLTSI